MPKVKISKQLIEMIANKDNSNFAKTINEKVNEILSVSIENLSKKVSYISVDNVILQPANELFNTAFIDGSNYVYLLGIENAQLNLNTIKKESKWKSFKKNLIYFWQNRKTFKKKKKRKKKKNESALQKKSNSIVDLTKYTILDLSEDLQQSISYCLSETSMIYLYKNCLQIVGKEDFGTNVKIIIYVTSYENEIFKHFVNNKKGYLDINFPNRYNFLTEKQHEIGESFTKMMKILNALFFNVNGYVPNQIFIESILCSCPKNLFEGEDIYKSYLKIINYLSVKTIRNIKSINDPSKTIHEDITCGNCGIAFNRVLENVEKEKL